MCGAGGSLCAKSGHTTVLVAVMPRPKLWSASAEIETEDYAMSLVRNRSSSLQVRLVQRERIGRRGTAGQSQERSSRNRSITSWAARGILLAVKYGRLTAP